MTVTSGAMSATPTDCAAQLSALGFTNPLGITGNQCTTVTVSSILPTTPGWATPPNDNFGGQSAQIGDPINMENEVNMRIVNFSGNTIVLQRGNYGVTTHPNGVAVLEACSTVPKWWDYTNAPHGAQAGDPYSQGIAGNLIDKPMNGASHSFTRDNFTVSDTYPATSTPEYPTLGLTPPMTCADFAGGDSPYLLRHSAPGNYFSTTTSDYGCIPGNANFDGQRGNGFGNYMEKHISPVQNVASNPSFFDARQYIMGPYWPQVVTKLGGAGSFLYKSAATAYNYDNPFDDKRQVPYIKVGMRTVRDVSAPGFLLPDTAGYNYTYCFAHKAGECYAGSTVNDIYINAPFVAKLPAGTAGGGSYSCSAKEQAWFDYQFNDICTGVVSANADYVAQYSAFHDPFSSGSRRITNAFHIPRTTTYLWNAPVLPNGDWTMIQNNGGQYGTRQMMSLAKVPPYPGPQRGINRGTWIPVPIRLGSVPAGTNNVYVRFGYNPSFQCSTRLENCVANGAGIQTGNSVYSYETSDAPAGLACTSGCTVTIPALSQRMMWYQIVYRNAGNATIKVGGAQVLATP